MTKAKLKEEEISTEEVTAVEEETKAEAPATKGSTTFTFKNGGTRTFSKEIHGSSFKDLADEFQETNKAILSSRDDKSL
jgi:hypothetical protein